MLAPSPSRQGTHSEPLASLTLSSAFPAGSPSTFSAFPPTCFTTAVAAALPPAAQCHLPLLLTVQALLTHFSVQNRLGFTFAGSCSKIQTSFARSAGAGGKRCPQLTLVQVPPILHSSMAGFPGRDYSNLLGIFTAERAMMAAEPPLPCTPPLPVCALTPLQGKLCQHHFPPLHRVMRLKQSG